MKNEQVLHKISAKKCFLDMLKESLISRLVDANEEKFKFSVIHEVFYEEGFIINFSNPFFSFQVRGFKASSFVMMQCVVKSIF